MTNFFIGMFLSALIVTLLTTRLYRLLFWYGLNSLFLGLAAIAEASYLGDREMMISGSITILLKAFAIPYILKIYAKRFAIERNITPSIRIQYSIILIPAILVFTFYLIDPLLHQSAKNFISISIASLLLSLLLIVEHRNIFAKVVGFLMMENSLFLLAMTATEGMPMLIELGIFFDLLMAVIIINLLLQREANNA
ncbi:hydrogenase [Nitratiruptor sp. YY09-18]|uniref:hydrogenase n=1 Tax=Nitratiruptor sp. YY09-18 TaxID=2724901 RepID=UPI001915E576|nr:hydrogenase [Nitratiruptor sp. YY09-18]BCD67287.1 hydrogenase-4 component E [Nitratiruptor sp. YY09-18]